MSVLIFTSSNILLGGATIIYAEFFTGGAPYIRQGNALNLGTKQDTLALSSSNATSSSASASSISQTQFQTLEGLLGYQSLSNTGTPSPSNLDTRAVFNIPAGSVVNDVDGGPPAAHGPPFPVAANVQLESESIPACTSVECNKGTAAFDFNPPDNRIKEYTVPNFGQDKEILAAKEMYLGRYYIEKEKWIPAINRYKTILENYDDTIYVEEAIHRLVEIHYKVGLIDESKK